MPESLHYVTNQQGERVGVMLDLETYNRLTNDLGSNPELLTNLSLDELQALAESMLAPKEQGELERLLVKNKETQLSPDENDLLDKMLAQVDRLNIIKTRARYTLNHLEKG